jgi:hypothetical protein
MSREGLEALRACVYADPELARDLNDVADARLGAEVVRAAAELRCDVTDDDVSTAIAQAREAWLLRWIL